MGRGKNSPRKLWGYYEHMLNLTMKKISIIILFLMIPAMCFADVLKIPFSCWPLELKSEFAAIGMKLDLSAVERTDDSWGFIVSNGADFELHTYRSVTQEEFAIIQDIVFKVELEKN